MSDFIPPNITIKYCYWQLMLNSFDSSQYCYSFVLKYKDFEYYKAMDCSKDYAYGTNPD